MGQTLGVSRMIEIRASNRSRQVGIRPGCCWWMIHVLTRSCAAVVGLELDNYTHLPSLGVFWIKDRHASVCFQNGPRSTTILSSVESFKKAELAKDPSLNHLSGYCLRRQIRGAFMLSTWPILTCCTPIQSSLELIKIIVDAELYVLPGLQLHVLNQALVPLVSLALKSSAQRDYWSCSFGLAALLQWLVLAVFVTLVKRLSLVGPVHFKLSYCVEQLFVNVYGPRLFAAAAFGLESSEWPLSGGFP